MTSRFDPHVILDSLGYLFLEGMAFTLMLTILSGIGGIALGTLLALARLSRRPLLRVGAGAYVNLMRALPLVLVIFWFYFLVPYAAAWLIGASRPVSVGSLTAALITFVLFEAAYFAEIVRAGIQSVPREQVMAGQALGLKARQVTAHIVLPQAFRNVLPLLLTQTIVLFQDTSLVYIVSMTDFLGAAAKIGQRDGRLVEMYLFVAVVYFLISLLASHAVRRLAGRTGAPA
ncbi:amino acid ABC transporter permease [Salinarimonas soli]|uniref:Glutamate/aspartate import permease protein GltK n=1 Tax=Salinarimonas soli TaxID=1638099 RepID=A0A5B2VH96_9HYPH|nr:amino acid ABC transporter permease [Salinarimonas soli]KAA2238264.1 amino acid ABC transporter permease [Salinarimonas soli]